MSRYLWTRKTVAKCHAGELGHGARTKAGENLLITRLQPVEKRSTQWRNALSPPTPSLPSPSPPLLRLASKQRIYEKDRSEKKTISPFFDSNVPHLIPFHRIDSSFNFKLNLFNISLYLSRSLRIKRKFRRSGNFSSTIQDIFPIHWGEKLFLWGKEKTNLIFARYLLRI